VTRVVPYVASMLTDLRRSPPPPGEPIFLHLGDFDDGIDGGPVSAARFHAAQRRLTERVLDAARIASGHDVIEVGCGFGGNLAVLDERVEGGSLVGVDIGQPQIALARERVRGRGENRLTWIEADAASLPVPDAAFDRLLAIECAFHFASRRAFLHEAARVLRARGRLALTDLVATPAGREAAAAGRLPDGLARALAEDLAPFPDPWGAAGSWSDLAAATGFSVDLAADRTAAAIPSFAFIFAGKTANFAGNAPPSDRGAAALRWLLERGFFRLELLTLERR
jgi:SAM-dependent methyltransferase